MRPQRAKALIVIHDRNEAAELSAMLQNAGLQTAMAFNLGMGLRSAALFLPTLLLVDRHIEGGDCVQFVQSLASLGSRVAAAYRVCVGCDEAHMDAPLLRTAGYDAFLSRPFDHMALLELVDRTVRRSPLDEGLPAHHRHVGAA
jgi:DNA-binding response OmpR family regulator